MLTNILYSFISFLFNIREMTSDYTIYISLSTQIKLTYFSSYILFINQATTALVIIKPIKINSKTNHIYYFHLL